MREFFKELIKSGLGVIVKFLIAFAIGTVVAGAVCLYYGIPIIFSLLGGILVLGFALVLATDSVFY